MIEWLKWLLCFSKKNKGKKMLDIAEMINRLILHEGLKLNPYKDTKGLLTIGIGRCIETNPFTYEEIKAVGDWQNGITRNAAYMLCKNDIIRCINELKKNISFFEKLDQERQYVLIDMCFNMGINKLLCFKKMLSALGIGNYNKAAEEILNSSYAKQVGKRADRLSNCIKTGRFEI